MRKRKLERELRRRLGKIRNLTGRQELEAGQSEEIGFGVTEPCAACPFRSDVTPYFFPLISSGLLEVAEGRSIFTCHETDPRSDYQGERKCGGKAQHCAGSLIFLDQTGVWSDSMVRGFLKKKWDNLKMSKRVPVFESLLELVSAYGAELRKGKPSKYFDGNTLEGAGPRCEGAG